MADRLHAFRKRIWDLLAAKAIPSKLQTDRTNPDSQRGQKRKLSLTPELEVDTAFKRLRITHPEIKAEYIDDEDSMMIDRQIDEECTIVSFETDQSIVESVEVSNPKKPRKKRRTKHEDSNDDGVFIKSENNDVGGIIHDTVRSSKERNVIKIEDSDDEFTEDHFDVNIKREGIWDEVEVERVPHVTNEDEDFRDWSDQELDFFNSLNDRGVEPMLWSYWKIDFPSLPDMLFTDDPDEAKIMNSLGKPATAAKAFKTLIEAGVYARDRDQLGQNAAQLLAREIRNYIRWSFRDAKLKQDEYLPLIVINFARLGEDLETTHERTHRMVTKVANQWLDLIEEKDLDVPKPTIFHIMIARTIMGIGSYNLDDEDPEYRDFFFTDWKNSGNDVWNAMAIALLVMQTRTWYGQSPDIKLDPKEPESDPDL